VEYIHIQDQKILCTQAQAGCQRSMSILYEVLLPQIKVVIRKKLFNLSNWDVENIAHDVATKILLNILKYDASRSIQAWAYTITSNYCVDLLRKRNRGSTISIESPEFKSMLKPSVNNEGGRDKSHIKDSFKIIKKLLDKQSALNCKIFMDRYFYGFTTKEICDRYGIKKDACLRITLRVRITLLQILGHQNLSRVDFI
jgi:RNA polymerase sigma factor (sigma-70 family)